MEGPPYRIPIRVVWHVLQELTHAQAMRREAQDRNSSARRIGETPRRHQQYIDALHKASRIFGLRAAAKVASGPGVDPEIFGLLIATCWGDTHALGAIKQRFACTGRPGELDRLYPVIDIVEIADKVISL